MPSTEAQRQSRRHATLARRIDDARRALDSLATNAAEFKRRKCLTDVRASRVIAKLDELQQLADEFARDLSEEES